ncbi:hypothetical protein D3C87_1161650 [compost metagenome]
MVAVKATAGMAAPKANRTIRRGRRMSSAAPHRRRARTPATSTWSRLSRGFSQTKGGASPRTAALIRFSPKHRARTIAARRRGSCRKAASITPLAGQAITAAKVVALQCPSNRQSA